MADVDASSAFLVETLPKVLRWPAPPSADDLRALPNTPSLYALIDAHDRPIQLATAQALRRLLTSRLTRADRPRAAADLAAITRGIRWRELSTAFEGRWWYYRAARQLYPREYRRLISFGPAYFLHVDWRQPVPIIRVTERAWCTEGAFIGPWQSQKDATAALEGLWDLFDLCRYPEQVRRAPRGSRCAYADMQRCDAPCDGAVPLDRYVKRCQDAWRFACDGSAPWLADAEVRMRQAAAEQAFERAGQIKHQTTFARHWAHAWEGRIGPLEGFNWLLSLPVPRRKCWRLMMFRTGELREGPVVRRSRLVEQATSWAQEALSAQPQSTDEVTRMEQTWLVAHLLSSNKSKAVLCVRFPLEATANDVADRVRKAAAAFAESGFGGTRDAAAAEHE